MADDFGDGIKPAVDNSSRKAKKHGPHISKREQGIDSATGNSRYSGLQFLTHANSVRSSPS